MDRLLLTLSLLGIPLVASSESASVSVELPEAPVYFVTAADTPYEDLMDPALVGLLKRYRVAIALAVYENQLDESLDRLYSVYEQAGVMILLWPLLPREHGLYLRTLCPDICFHPELP